MPCGAVERAERSEAMRELMAKPLAPAMRATKGCGGRCWREGGGGSGGVVGWGEVDVVGRPGV